jgi:hypothetical protein
MGLTTYPQPFQKSAQAYINAGITYNGVGGQLLATGFVGSTQSLGTYQTGGYVYASIPTGQTTTLSWSAPSSTTYGSTWYAEIYVPTLTVSTTVASTISVLTTDAVTASGSTVINVSSTAGIVSGLIVSGVGIPNATTVSSVGFNQITLSNAINRDLFKGTSFTFTPTNSTWPIGVTALPLTSVANIVTLSGSGTNATCTGLAASTYVTSVSNNVVTLSAATTGSIASGTAFTSTPAITWSGVSWHNNVTPTQAIGGRSIYLFTAPGDGSLIYGRQIMANLAGAGL